MWRPAKYFVEVTKREKRACKKCEERGVAMAPLPARIIDMSLVSDSVIIDTIVNKYTAHLPLYRQSALLGRDYGIEITRATMCGWVMTVGAQCGAMVSGLMFQPWTCTTGEGEASSGSSAVSSRDSPGMSSIQLSDQGTGAMRSPDDVCTAR